LSESDRFLVDEQLAKARELVGFLWAAMTPPLVAPAYAA
jgi:hypothetical protein